MTSHADVQAPVQVAVTDGVAHLTLDNPGRKNAISLGMARLIEEFCVRVEDDESIGGVVIDAVGDYFCSGADTRDLAASSSDPASTEALRRTSAVYDTFVRIGSLPVPTVSVVVGGAVGAGLNLALATDVLLVTPDAVLDSGFLARGIHPGGGHYSLLGRTLNRQQAMVLGVLGVPLSGTEAVRLGLAWNTYPDSTIRTEAAALLKLAARDPDLARRAKRSADLELGPHATTWPAAVELERGVQMWSLGRKSESGWKTHPPRPTVDASAHTH
ncbi:MAG: enoyl-CoA hydratase [Rhodococcus sp. (in: high G+C Gram-positive bacteria)]|jgi:enoyl-CoA hydratase|nr:MAG: enoyl-CoA hydratase [Rhodococcus sp. (in: high G+C Gram-positive bacteria)]